MAGVGPLDEAGDAAHIGFAAAGAVAATALLPFPYAARASVVALLGAVLAILGLRGSGPLAGLAADGGELRDAMRLVALSALPAVLFFRSQYQTYARARGLVVLGLLLATPFAGLEVHLALDATAPTVARVAAWCSLGAVLTGLTGLGSKASVATAACGWLVLGMLPAELALRELTPLAGDDVGKLAYVITAAGVTFAGILASLGLCQLLAALLGQHARKTARVSRADEHEVHPSE
jgi:hypothetical protein